MIARNVGSPYSLAYDAENRLTGVTGSTNASFLYDGDGNRVQGTVGSTTTVYIGNYFEWTGSTDTMNKYYYAGSTRVAMRTGTGTGTTGLKWLLEDHLGSTNVIVNGDGSSYNRLTYKPWGETRAGVSSTTFKYTGQRQDSYINLYWYGSRWYDDALGRFIQPDSIIPDPSNPADYDRYSYVRNNPLRYTDPTGHSACWDENANDIGCKSYTPTAYGLQPKDYSHSNNSNEPQNTPFDSSLGGNNDANQNGLSNQQNSKNGTKPQQQSPAAGSINEPPPFEKRAATVVFMLPFFALVDRALVTTTIANSAALVQDPEPITKLILVSSEIIIIGTDVGVSVLEISYAHWVANGDWINSWDDLSNW